MGFFTINLRFLPLKFHYGLFNAGTSTVQPTMPVYAKVLKFSSFIVGTIYTILPILALIIKPLFGGIADKYKSHRAVLIAWEIIIIIGYFAVQYIPPPQLPQVSISTPQHYSLSALSACSSPDAPPYLLAESGRCVWTCDMTLDRCSQWNLNSYCSLYDVPNEQALLSCLPVPLTKNLNVTKSECKLRCPRGIQLKEDEDDYLTEAETFSTWQFWVFLILLIATWAGTAVVTTISDTVSIEICGDIYGRQRMWGSIMWGVFALINGFAIDAISNEGEDKDYTPAFYIMLVPLVIDVILTYFLEINLPEQSESIGRDVLKVVLKPRTVLFMFWCAMVGASFGLLWNFLFWLLEDLAAASTGDYTSMIKTIEGLITAVQCIVGEGPAFFIGGWVVNKVGYEHSLSLVFLAIGVRFTLYSILVNPWWCLPIEVLQNNYGLFYSTMTSYAKKIAEPGTEATIQMILSAVCEGIGIAIGSFLGGLFYDNYGGSLAFRIFGITFLVLVIINETVEFFFRKMDRRDRTMISNSNTSIS